MCMGKPGLSPFCRKGLKTRVVLLRLRLHHFRRGLWQVFDETACRKPAYERVRAAGPPARGSQDAPGDPANRASAGTTVFGGMTVLSAILAQSLMIVNFPCHTVAL